MKNAFLSALVATLILTTLGCPGPSTSTADPIAPERTATASHSEPASSPEQSEPAREEEPPARAEEPPARDPVEEQIAQGEPRREQADEAITREELLALDPADLFYGGLRGAAPGGLAPEATGVGVIAFGEQLEAGEVPHEALDLCLIQLLRAQEELQGSFDPAARARLARNLAVQTEGLPALDRWMVALLEAVHEPADLDAAVVFVHRARQTWAMAARIRALGKPR